MEDNTTRRGYINLVLSGLITTSGCSSINPEEENFMEHILDNPSNYIGDRVTVEGKPEYIGEMKYSIRVYDYSKEKYVNENFTEETFKLYSGENEVFFTEEDDDRILNTLNKGEKLQAEIEVTGYLEPVNSPRGTSYMISNAQIEL